jgi:hypothetical protein
VQGAFAAVEQAQNKPYLWQMVTSTNKALIELPCEPGAAMHLLLASLNGDLAMHHDEFFVAAAPAAMRKPATIERCTTSFELRPTTWDTDTTRDTDPLRGISDMTLNHAHPDARAVPDHHPLATEACFLSNRGENWRGRSAMRSFGRLHVRSQ